MLQPAVVCGFQELTGSVQELITQALDYIKNQETEITAIKLSGLSLEGPTEVREQTPRFIFSISLDFYKHH